VSEHQLEQREKHARLTALMDERGYEAIILRKAANIAWLIGGRAHVPTTLELACMDLVIRRSGIEVITNKIEANRLSDEELSGDEKITVINWFESRDGQLPSGEKIAIDGPDPLRINASGEIESLRRSLNPQEALRLRALAGDTAVALGVAMRTIDNSDSEVVAAGKISAQLWAMDIEPVVLLVAGEKRLNRYRHPLPTKEEIGARYMGVVCGRRKGLIASVTRIATFSPLSNEDKDWYSRLLAVERVFLNESKVGVKLSQVVERGIAEYIKEGFDSDEWTRHHQGGPTGYLPRDFPAHTKSEQVIAPDTALAWNPSGKGWKVEDTIFIGARGLEVLTVDSDWPSEIHFERARPAILER
jgi:antitoxin VapB